MSSDGLSEEDLAALREEIVTGIAAALAPMVGETMHPAFARRNAMVRIDKWIAGAIATEPTNKTGRGR